MIVSHKQGETYGHTGHPDLFCLDPKCRGKVEIYTRTYPQLAYCRRCKTEYRVDARGWKLHRYPNNGELT